VKAAPDHTGIRVGRGGQGHEVESMRANITDAANRRADRD